MLRSPSSFSSVSASAIRNSTFDIKLNSRASELADVAPEAITNSDREKICLTWRMDNVKDDDVQATIPEAMLK